MDMNLLSQFLNSGANDPEAAQIKRQQMMADRLRAQSLEMPQTQMVGGVALRNTGQALSNLASGVAAGIMQPKLDQQQQAMQQRTNQARTGYADALSMALRRPYPQQQTPVLPPDGYEDQ